MAHIILTVAFLLFASFFELSAKGFPVMGFNQRGKIIVPSFQDSASSSLPLEMYAWRMEPRSKEPLPTDLKTMGPFKLIFDEKLSRDKLTTVPGQAKWLVPQGAKSASVYRFAVAKDSIEGDGVPVIIFDQELTYVADYQRRSVAYSDKEYLDNLGFKDVERTYQALWPTLTKDGTVYRLMELPNGAGYSYFLNTIKGFECEKTLPIDFYSQEKSQQAAEDEMTAASCGGLSFQ